MAHECAVCYVTDRNFLLPSLIAAARLRRFIPRDKADVFIFAIDIDLVEIELIARNVEPDGIQIVQMESSWFSGADWAKANKTHVPLAALGRLFIEELLPANTRRIVYFDGDTWIKENPLSLIDIVLDEGRFAAVDDLLFFSRNDITKYGKFVREYFKRLNINGDNGYFNSGVFVVGRSTYRVIAADAIQFFKKNTEICYYHDQSALNAVIGNRRVRLSPRWNFQTPFRYWNVDQKVDPVIYHFTQANKPWSGPVLPWTEMYEQYKLEIERFTSLNLPLKQLSLSEISAANAEAFRLGRRLRWLMPLRLMMRQKQLIRMASEYLE